MPISSKKVVDKINSRLNNENLPSSNIFKLAEAANSVSSVYSVDTLADLPSPENNIGRFIYIKEIEGYRYSDGVEWSNEISSVRTENNPLYSWGYNFRGNLGLGGCSLAPKNENVVFPESDWCFAVSNKTNTGYTTNSLAIKKDGTLWGWGYNDFGTLGDGTILRRDSPVSVLGGFTDWCNITLGYTHATGIRKNGSLWGWGGVIWYNVVPYTGLNIEGTPIQIANNMTFSKTSPGTNHVLGLKNNSIWSWGWNRNGQLGDGTDINKSSPVTVVGGFNDWCDISAGSIHSVGLRTNGTLWAWGYNNFGQVGNGIVTTGLQGGVRSPVSVVGGFTDWCQISSDIGNIALRSNGTLWAWGDHCWGSAGNNITTSRRSSPVSIVGGFTNWCQTSSGRWISAGIRTDGTLWTWGLNSQGQLGIGTIICRSSPVTVLGGFTDWCRICAGSGFAMTGIRTAGSIWSWGCNNSLQLGNGSLNRSSPVSLITNGYTPGTSDWCKISNNGSTGLAQKTNGTLWAWGGNNFSLLGEGSLTISSSASPIQVLGNSSDFCIFDIRSNVAIGLKTNGTVWAWGSNELGRFGNNFSGCSLSPVNLITGNSGWLKSEAGKHHTLALKSNGTLWAWGANRSGQIGDSSYVDTLKIVKVAGGITNWCDIPSNNSFESSSAITKDGTLWVWGEDRDGSLGTGCANFFANSPVSVLRSGDKNPWISISSGDCHSLALRNDNTVWAWGWNITGQIGDGTVTNKSSPVSVVGGFTDWCQISAGGAFSVAVRSNGTLWTWGSAGDGRLGDGTTTNKSSPVSVLGGFTDWCGVSAAVFNTAAIRSNGTLWMWGLGQDGRNGNGFVYTCFSPVSVVGGFTDWCQFSSNRYHTLAIRSNGTLWAWGSNSFGALGGGFISCQSSPVTVIGGFADWCQASAGRFHSLAVRSNGTVWAWGSGSNGRLGNNNTVASYSPVSVVGGFTDWCQVSAGFYHSIAQRTNGELWAWGSNNCGQLGTNTTIARSSPVTVIGGFTDWSQFSADGCNTGGLRSNGSIWTWGANGTGQLGDGTTVTRSSPTSAFQTITFTKWSSASLGCRHSNGISNDGKLWAWGNQGIVDYLGDGSSINRSSPVTVVGGFTNWCQVSAGKYGSMAIRTNGTLWAWGRNAYNTLLLNNVPNTTGPLFTADRYTNSPLAVSKFNDWCFVNLGSYATGIAIRSCTKGF